MQATTPASVDHVPAWLVAASTVRSPLIPFSSPVTAKFTENLSQVNSERIANTIDDTLAARGSEEVRSVDGPKEPTPVPVWLERDT